jgi:hypothetical protein
VRTFDVYRSANVYAWPGVTGTSSKYHLASPLLRAVMSTRTDRWPSKPVGGYE